MTYNTLEELRTARNTKLAETDWIFLSDSPRSRNEVYYELLKVYRQQLRDITRGVTDDNVAEVELPTLPEYVDD